MANSVNKVILVGRLGKDPEMKHTSVGTPVTHFSLATDELWKDLRGEKSSAPSGITSSPGASWLRFAAIT
jgi:single stranded DNA-binding protein